MRPPSGQKAPPIAASTLDSVTLKQAEIRISETNKGNVIVNIADIVLCQSDGANVELLVARQHDTEILRTSKTMKELEEELPEQSFFRTHNSFIVNIRAIERWERTGRNGLVLLKNGMRVPVSVQKLMKFEARMKEV